MIPQTSQACFTDLLGVAQSGQISDQDPTSGISPAHSGRLGHEVTEAHPQQSSEPLNTPSWAAEKGGV